MDVIFVPFHLIPRYGIVRHSIHLLVDFRLAAERCEFYSVSRSPNVEMKSEWKFNVKIFVTQTIYYKRLKNDTRNIILFAWQKQINERTHYRSHFAFIYIHECGLKILSLRALVFLAGKSTTPRMLPLHSLYSHVDALEIGWLVFKAKNDL